jgi:tetratricopeptide (TPR) repeat protein
LVLFFKKENLSFYFMNPDSTFTRGLAAYRQNRFTEAEEAFRAAAQGKPGWALPHYELGRTLAAQGDREGAARAYRMALKARPDFLQAEVNLANVLKALGKLDQAISAYRRVLRRHPDEPEVHHNLGVALRESGDAAGAEAALRAALRCRPDFGPSLETLTGLLMAAGRAGEACPVAEAACRALPGRADLLEMLGDARRGAKHYDGALAAYDEALAVAPNRHSARFARAEALRLKRDFAGAEAVLRDLVRDLPDRWLSHHDLGNVLRDQGRFEEAEACYRTSLALTETPLALNHLAAVARDLGRLDEAVALAERGLALAPGDQDLQYNLCITHLTAGRLREGFALYDVRFTKYKVAAPPGRAWAGQDLRGRTVLVEAEQGLGDTLHFVRYVPALAARGARVVLRVGTPLVRLLAGFPGTQAVLDRAGERPAYDFHVALMSLPDRLGLPEPCPIPVPYLAADPDRVAAWRSRLAALPGRPVGLAWAGNPGFLVDHLRSVPPALLAPLATAEGVSFVSLQKGAREMPAFPIVDWTAALTDMAETAALIGALDLVVSVDTAVAHLAGALGKPVWLLNRFDTCWRWGMGRQDCAWYPSLRQFRQDRPGDWSVPVTRVAAALRHISLI